MSATAEAAPTRESDLPEFVRSTVEALAAYMGADAGNWTLELTFEDGRFSRFRRHHGPAGARGLADFADGG